MRLKYIFLLAPLALGLVSCNDFLDREPMDFGNETTYFKSASDFEMSVNGFYDYLPKNNSLWGGIYNEDCSSDDQCANGGNELLYEGTKATPTAYNSKWGTSAANGDFYKLRGINFFLTKAEENYNTATGDRSLINHYIGEGYFFRALVYFDLLTNFGDCPIVTEMMPDDQAYLTARSVRAPRNEVARFILSDLDKASHMLKDVAPASGRICKAAAYALKSRVALFEATWEKYHAGTCFVPGNDKWPGKKSHPDFKFVAGSPEAEVNFFLQQCIEASDSAAKGRSLDPDYASMFNNWQTTFPDNHEVILARYYQEGIISHSCSAYLRGGAPNGMTRAAVNTFLMTNGLPIYAEGSGYHGDRTSYEEFIDRDHRLTESVRSSGIVLDENGDIEFKYLAAINQTGIAQSSTGYELKKYYSDDVVQSTQGKCSTAVPLFRVAECYLNYLEAYYLLNGNLGGNCDTYWRALRHRAGVDTDYNKTIANTDLEQENDLAVWSKGVAVDKTLYNIRRERRNEFIAEGMRLRDMKRWRSFDKMVNYQPEGFNLWEYLWTLYNNPSSLTEMNSISQASISNYLHPLQKSSTAMYYNGYTFPKPHYLEPLPISELLLTGGGNAANSPIYQNPGWPGTSDGKADYNYDCD